MSRVLRPDTRVQTAEEDGSRENDQQNVPVQLEDGSLQRGQREVGVQEQ